MNLEKKLSILADAAKYDVSCASSGSRRRNTKGRLGNAAPSGICHTYTEDGRCVSLLKILFTNVCVYDCAYCVNRSGNDVPRAAFTPDEVVDLTIDFYRRNYIEGLFLSSGVARSPDDTMERLVRTVRDLRGRGFNGYIHLKCVPFASRRLIRQAGRHADRLSVNIELPTDESLQRLTVAKTHASVLDPMNTIHETIAATREDRRRMRHVPVFAPAGQSTQLIIGASPESDYEILHLSDRLYRRQALKRVYYSAYMPLEQAAARLPAVEKPPLKRENRLYQADWLMRLYGFDLDEVIGRDNPHLDLAIDPKLAFALRNPALFPVDVNTAAREMILRVPGIGIKSAHRIVGLRQRGRIRFEHLRQMGVALKRAAPFILCDGQPATQWSSNAAPDPDEAPRRQDVAPDAGTDATPTVFVTDGTFDGLLTAIFESYNGGPPPSAVAPAARSQPGLFEARVAIVTDPHKADRVWRGLKTHLGAKGRRRVLDAFLSGRDGVETLIAIYVRDAVRAATTGSRAADLSARIEIDRLSQQVRREAHRLKGFIRFRQTGDGRYLALTAPRYDVLPLVRRHFETRYADQEWIIYDTRRHYGLCYDGRRVRRLWLTDAELKALERAGEDEKQCQVLWQKYFTAVNIPQRRNPKLHRSHLPRRFWRYLPEKQG
ncbi:MAG: putative DNA modification/repair radical SAM protein [Desulfobacterales bacterium]|nr:putative DNA modification/repair radical SAM protein [Desulfobacterales bacterium]MDJ0889034.1 putative DNA modification/repair radical SAM protein [Desulfobacterales bacterium]MDJ0989085.1 putative DNA modification/repair radical SAM protein [Desulfobacterales bacterium]